VQRLVDAAVVVIAVVIPTLDAQSFKEVFHGSCSSCVSRHVNHELVM
jgi:hypothetical protein